MNHVCSDCAVRDKALCAALSDDELARLNRIGRRQRLARGEHLQWAGDESLIFANIIDGVLKLSTATADGREQIVGLLYPGDFLGRLFAIQVEYDATALTDAELCIFPRQQFEAALSDHARLERALLERTLSELDTTRQWMLLLGRKTAEEKLASFLLHLAGRQASDACPAHADTALRFELPLTRRQIADVLGLTIETVSRQMTKLRAAGVIDAPDSGSVIIRDRTALDRLSESAA